MINLVIRQLITMAALKGADLFLDNFNFRGGFFPLFCFSIVLGILNWLIKPILVFFSIPFIVLTIGFFYIVINALILYTSSILMPGVLSASTFGIVWGSIFVSLFHWLLTAILRVREKK